MPVPANQQISPTEERLAVPQESCDVKNRRNLESYRALYHKWMGWYGYSADNPNTIEGQIMSMMFHDLTYRCITGVRASLPSEAEISARSSTLAYIIDSGYLATQVLAISKLADDRTDVVSILRLVKDIKKNRKSITREVYVAGFGAPYDPMKWREEHVESHPMVQMSGLQAPELSRWLPSHYAHERFDALSGVPFERRSREDMIQPKIFERIINWEWRIVTRPLNCTQDSFGYRAGPSTLIPYFRLPLQEAESLGIQEIIIGPTPHPKQSLSSVEGLLTKYGIETREITSTTAVKLKLSRHLTAASRRLHETLHTPRGKSQPQRGG